MKSSPFRFKQFELRQDRCSMKMGSDTVLLASLIPNLVPSAILDIGTGSGVIALMLAQKFPLATTIDAIELDEESAVEAAENFRASPWPDRLHLIHHAFETYSFSKGYDLIVCNPPFYLNALSSGNLRRDTARHADEDLFAQWLQKSAQLLSEEGMLYWVLPAEQEILIRQIALEQGLKVMHLIKIRSFPGSPILRILIGFSLAVKTYTEEDFVIYDKVKRHSEQYRNALKDYFIIF